MKTAVIYYSQSGQTKKLADAIAGALPDSPTATPMQEADAPEPSTLVFFGFPIERFGPAKPAAEFLADRLAGHKVALFVTHASPEGTPQVEGWLEGCRQAAAGCDLVGCFDCQGELAMPVKQFMLASDDPGLRAWAEGDTSQGQPDAARLERARTFARDVARSQSPGT
jgi:flavodoxin